MVVCETLLFLHAPLFFEFLRYMWAFPSQSCVGGGLCHLSGLWPFSLAAIVSVFSGLLVSSVVLRLSEMFASCISAGI